MNILIVGGGSMGQAFTRGILKPENGHTCFVVEHDPINKSVCKDAGGQVFQKLEELHHNHLLDDLEACILAVKPNDIENISSDVVTYISKDCLVISIAAGVTINTLQSYFKGFPVVRAMPNLAASQLLSATAMCTSDGLIESDLLKANTILEMFGTVVQVKEDQMDLVTAISGSGPAYFFLLAELLIDAAEKRGLDPQIAHQLVSQTFVGAATVAKIEGSICELREKVTSPGGTTQAALAVFEENKLEEIISKAVDSAISRSAELRGG